MDLHTTTSCFILCSPSLSSRACTGKLLVALWPPESVKTKPPKHGSLVAVVLQRKAARQRGREGDLRAAVKDPAFWLTHQVNGSQGSSAEEPAPPPACQPAKSPRATLLDSKSPSNPLLCGAGAAPHSWHQLCPPSTLLSTPQVGFACEC